MATLSLTYQTRPGDSPEVGWTEHFRATLDTDDYDKTIYALNVGLNRYIDSMGWALFGSYDYVTVRARIKASAVAFISACHEGLTDRMTWHDEHTDEYATVSRLSIIDTCEL